jgi:hypothetical protein
MKDRASLTYSLMESICLNHTLDGLDYLHLSRSDNSICPRTDLDVTAFFCCDTASTAGAY